MRDESKVSAVFRSTFYTMTLEVEVASTKPIGITKVTMRIQEKAQRTMEHVCCLKSFDKAMERLGPGGRRRRSWKT